MSLNKSSFRTNIIKICVRKNVIFLFALTYSFPLIIFSVLSQKYLVKFCGNFVVLAKIKFQSNELTSTMVAIPSVNWGMEWMERTSLRQEIASDSSSSTHFGHVITYASSNWYNWNCWKGKELVRVRKRTLDIHKIPIGKKIINMNSSVYFSQII